MTYIAKRILDTESSATVKIADLTEDMRRQGRDVLDFSAGRAAESTPDNINRAAIKAICSGDTHQTMALGKPDFREACSRKLSRENNIDADPEKSIIATLGCKHGTMLALLSIINPGDEVIIEDPCFVSYPPLIRYCGGIPIPVALRQRDRFRWKKGALEGAVTKKTKAILFCSPHNPTGVVHDEEDLDYIAQIAHDNDLLVISDETYERVTWGERHHICIATRPGMKNRSITVMSLTKTFAMGGWRIGFVYSSPEIISGMAKVQQHIVTCPGSFTQGGAYEALYGETSREVESLWKDWEKRCQFVTSEINKIPNLSCDPPEGGFYAWIDIHSTEWQSISLTEKLLKEQQIALVPGAAFGTCGEGYLRMTCVKSWEDLKRGLIRLREGITHLNRS